MKFGLFYELSTPRPFTRETQKAVYENAIAQAVLADELGFSSVWCVEHHGGGAVLGGAHVGGLCAV